MTTVDTVQQAIDALYYRAVELFDSLDTVQGLVKTIDTGLAGKAPVAHGHTIANIDSLRSELDLLSTKIASAGTGTQTAVYNCTGVDDDLGLENLIKDFINNEWGTSIKTISIEVVGRFVWRKSAPNNRCITITGVTGKGAGVFLNFERTTFKPYVSSDPQKHFIYVDGQSAINLAITGLRLDMAGTIINANNCSLNIMNSDVCSAGYSGGSGLCAIICNNSHVRAINCILHSGAGPSLDIMSMPSTGVRLVFTHCAISNAYNWSPADILRVRSTFAGALSIVNCQITGSYTGYSGLVVESANTAAQITLVNTFVRAPLQDIRQTTAAGTIKWHIEGCTFSKASVIVDGTAAISSKTASANIYFPANANKFSRVF